MKKIFLTVTLSILILFAIAQKTEDKDVFALTITENLQNPNDSITIIQIQMPDGFRIDEKQLGLVRRNFTNNKEDTANIGYGKCQLIKGDYYYFGIKLYDKKIKPQAKDLIYTRFDYATKFKGLIYGLTKNAIYLSNAYDSALYNFSSALWIDEKNEQDLIKKFVSDIQFTAKAMLQQMPALNNQIKGGIFNGKKLFDAMQICTDKDVIKFLKYVNARPKKYAGNTWKISEVFATWMVSETPTIIE
jgi:hypothetical protein